MQKRSLITSLLFIVAYFASAQVGHNSWINYNQSYIRFKVSEEGIYRIERNDLVSHNNAFITVNPKNLQVFAKGVEQPIYVYGENDLSFDSGDYIELYCQKNDGFLDSLMYEDPSEMNNPYYSQVNDTLSYYITWENSPTEKKRYSTYSSANYGDYNSLNSVIQKDFYSYNSKFYWGQRIASYSTGKGWFDTHSFVYDAPRTKDFDISNRLLGSDVNVEYSACGVPNSDVYSNLQHHLKVSYESTVMSDATYTGYGGVKDNFTINSPTQDILQLEFSSNYNIGGQVDKNTLAYVFLEYQRNLSFDNQGEAKFLIPIQDANARLSLTNFSESQVYLYNLTGKERTISVNNGGTWELVINHSTNVNQFFAAASDSIHIVTELEQADMVNYTNFSEDPDYIIVYHPSLSSGASEYEAYRSAQGYKVLKVDIEQLYHQFAYGIYKHPMSIRNFIEYISTEYSMPEYLFLIGKSVSTAIARNDSSGYSNCLVPTMGNPASDLLLTSGLDNGQLKPALATGRLAARTNADVELYLEKVQAYEAQTSAIWQKNAIHFGGGGNTYEQNTFKNNLKEYELLYEDTLIGGFVTTFLKNSSDPIQISVSDSVEILINGGVSILNFFGHGSSSGFDQNIDEPGAYNNNGKYPLIIANSCLSGDIHQNTSYKTISEKWLLIGNKGAIGFLASSDLGFASQLHFLSREFYKSLSYRLYGHTLGKIIQDAIQHYSQNQENNSYVRKTVLDNTLHGDPAIRIYYNEKPDLSIESSGLNFAEQPITSEIDSFNITIDYYNVGRAFVDSFLISVERTYPNGQSDLFIFQQTSSYYNGQISVKLPTNAMDALGQNRVKVQLDYLGQIDELREDNNEISIDFLVHSDDLVPVYPYEFAVVSEATQSLKASSGNPFADNFVALFQIDTTDSFDSPFLQSTSIATNGGVTEWTLPFNLSDSTVYFWRVSREGTDRWRESSFRYIHGKEGWSQAHHFQFKNDDFQFVNYLKEDRAFEYITTPKNLVCKTFGIYPVNFLQVGFWIDGVGDHSSCGSGSAFAVVVIDSLTLEPWRSDRYDYGHRDYPTCTSRTNPDKYFQFTSTDSLAMENFAVMLNSIPDGNHVLIYTLWDGNYSNLPENTLQAIEQLNPSSQVRDLGSYVPYILYLQKGFPSTVQEVVGTSGDDEITLSVDLNTNFDYGNIYTKLIGPSTEWKSFHWDYRNNINQKNTDLKIIGINQQGQEQVLIEGLTEDSLDILNLSDRIDAEDYPFLKLQMYTKDSILKEPTQLNSWTLLFDEVPETAVEPNHAYYFHKDTVEQGEKVVFAISTHNISSKDMDSLMVSYYVRDNENEVELIKSTKLRPHPSADFITDTVVFNTINSRGEHSLWVEFNPIDSLTGVYDQVEQYHFNNIALKYFYVEADHTNPLLNVTFDGIHIMDGDIVSPNPEILIKINDENRYLTMDDPESVSIYLKKIDDSDEVKVEQFDSLSNQQLFWYPSSLPDNIAEMMFAPKNLPDGIYSLRVGATDASSNESGLYDYQINFEVINKSTITEVLNYPNPFSTSTQFVFTLTGAEIPEEIVVQIMTVTGKVVKEINLAEQSDLRIGRNITTYKWDGRDTYGDLLANGVYFYRMIVKNAGKSVEMNATQASKYFKEGIGKMYIIR